jgi:hypothetical protein
LPASTRRSRLLSTAARQTVLPLAHPSARSVAAEVAARRCRFCGSDRAHFGYGPPLVHTPFWVCRAHRPDAEACAAAGTSPQPITTNRNTGG